MITAKEAREKSLGTRIEEEDMFSYHVNEVEREILDKTEYGNTRCSVSGHLPDKVIEYLKTLEYEVNRVSIEGNIHWTEISW